MSWIPDHVGSAMNADPLFDKRAAAAMPLARVGTPPLLTPNQVIAADDDHVTIKYRELIVFAKKSGGNVSVVIGLATGIIAVKFPDAMGVDVRYEPFDV